MRRVVFECLEHGVTVDQWKPPRAARPNNENLYSETDGE
jgi:hypothetical protein